MRDDRFEWDDRKDKSNLRKHGVSFEFARLAFDDPRAIANLDEEQADEDRLLLIGLADARGLLTVCYTERGHRYRIISAWKSTQNEIDDYNRANPQEPWGQA